MNVTRSVLVERHRFKQYVIASLSLIFAQIDNLVDRPLDLECIWIHLLANFALKSFPVEWTDILILSVWRLFLLLGQHPILKALEMDKSYCSFALASDNKGIALIFIWAPANSALNIVFAALGTQIRSCCHLLSFFQLLIVKFSLGHLYFLAFEVFYSESDSAEFNGIELLNLVIVLSGLIFEWPRN